MNSVKSVDIRSASKQPLEQNEHKNDAYVRNEKVDSVEEEKYCIYSLNDSIYKTTMLKRRYIFSSLSIAIYSNPLQ